MSYASRIKQVEKSLTRAKGPIQIEVSVVEDPEFDQEYALFQARKALGLVSFNEQQRTIFVCGPETEARYEDMTVTQAKKILATCQSIDNKKKDLQK
jgi:hypothetical protein